MLLVQFPVTIAMFGERTLAVQNLILLACSLIVLRPLIGTELLTATSLSLNKSSKVLQVDND